LKCQRCGFDDIRALSIDHINGGGRKHTREMKLRSDGRALYEWIKEDNYPQGFQVLCMNCQWIKRDENLECSSHKAFKKMLK
jgi:hypothetical protein